MSNFEKLKIGVKLTNYNLLEKFSDYEISEMKSRLKLFTYSFNIKDLVVSLIEIRNGTTIYSFNIRKCKDEWFYVSYKTYMFPSIWNMPDRYIDPNNDHNYKCDQVDGLIDCIKFITK